jgi:hypothetical protein
MKKSVRTMIEAGGFALEAWELLTIALALLVLVGFGVFKVLVWVFVK